jgi:hypothetical protein
MHVLGICISPVGGDRWGNGKGNKGYKGFLMLKSWKDTDIIWFLSEFLM